MSRPPRPGGLAAALAAALVFLAACADADGPRRGGTVVIAAASDLDHANPLVSAEGLTNEVLRYALFAPLIRYGPNLEFVPHLAERWEMLADTGVVFHLRRDVRWHDGTPTTAHDVLFTFDRARDPATGFPNAVYVSQWKGGEVLDSFTVRFTFEPHAEPLAGWPFMPPVPRHLLDTVPPERMRQTPFNRHPVGNGPFRFVSQRTNDRWVFEANPDHAGSLGGPPLLERVIWRVIPDNTAQITELRVGDVDLALHPRPEQVVELEGRGGIRAIVKPSRQFAFIAWNALRPPLDDPRVRRALALGIDRRRILDGLRRGFGDLAAGPILPGHWSHDVTLEPLPYSPDSARALLRAAGITDRNGDGVLDRPDGSPFRIELKLPAGNNYNRDVAEAVRGSLAALGIDVRTRPTEANTLIADITSAARNFDAVQLGWTSDFRLDLHDTFHSEAVGGPYQFASYRNAALDSVIERAVLETDRDRATPLWRRANRILRDDQPWTVLYYQTDAFLIRDRVHGVEMDIRGALLSLPRWWVDRPAERDDPPTPDLDAGPDSGERTG